MIIKKFQIKLYRTSSDLDPKKPAWAAADLTQIPQLCQLIGTEDTLFTTTQLVSIGAEFPLHALASVPVTIESDSPSVEAPAVKIAAVFNEVEMTEILEIAYLALEPYTSVFDHIAETSDLDDEYLIALRAKIAAAMDSDVPPRELPAIVPGMRVRWNDPDDGLCTHEGIVKRCTTPNEEETIVIFLEDGWSTECFRNEIEIL